jgi:hypothetical protein
MEFQLLFFNLFSFVALINKEYFNLKKVLEILNVS